MFLVGGVYFFMPSLPGCLIVPINKHGHRRPAGGTSLPRRLYRGRYVT
jgi:hypothetical protein